MLANQNLGSMSRGFFVHKRSVASLLSKFRQTKYSYLYVQTCTSPAHIYPLSPLCFTDTKYCERVPSDTRALTPNLSLCSTATQYIVPTGTS